MLLAERLVLLQGALDGSTPVLSVVDEEVGCDRQPEDAEVRVEHVPVWAPRRHEIVLWVEVGSIESRGEAREDPVTLVLEDVSSDFGNTLVGQRALRALLWRHRSPIMKLEIPRDEAEGEHHDIEVAIAHPTSNGREIHRVDVGYHLSDTILMGGQGPAPSSQVSRPRRISESGRFVCMQDYYVCSQRTRRPLARSPLAARRDPGRGEPLAPSRGDVVAGGAAGCDELVAAQIGEPPAHVVAVETTADG